MFHRPCTPLARQSLRHLICWSSRDGPRSIRRLWKYDIGDFPRTLCSRRVSVLLLAPTRRTFAKHPPLALVPKAGDSHPREHAGIVAAVLIFGTARLAIPQPGPQVKVGLVASDVNEEAANLVQRRSGASRNTCARKT